MKIPSSITVLNIKNVVLAVLSLAWKDWKRKASNFPPEVAFQLYPFHWFTLYKITSHRKTLAGKRDNISPYEQNKII